MIFLFDTNVLSERTKKKPNPNVEKFMAGIPAENVRVSSMVIAEICQGVENNPTPALQTFLADVLTLPVADFGEFEALEWGRLTSAALASGLEIQTRDSIIAATAKSRGWTVAARNVDDFKPLGVLVKNPFEN